MSLLQFRLPASRSAGARGLSASRLAAGGRNGRDADGGSREGAPRPGLPMLCAVTLILLAQADHPYGRYAQLVRFGDLAIDYGVRIDSAALLVAVGRQGRFDRTPCLNGAARWVWL